MLDKINSFVFTQSNFLQTSIYGNYCYSYRNSYFSHRKIFSKKLAPKWISRLWLLVVIALICPIQFSIIFSIYNYIPSDTLVLFYHTIEEIPNILFRKEYDTSNQELKETLTENIDVANKEQLKKQNNDALYIKSLFADVLLSYI